MSETEKVISRWTTKSGEMRRIVKTKDKFIGLNMDGYTIFSFDRDTSLSRVEEFLRCLGYNKLPEVPEEIATMTDDQVLAELQAPDMVKHPPHYTFGEYEVKDVIEDWGFGTGFHLGNAIKYIARAQHKGNYIQDIEKAQEYLGFEIEAERKREEKKRKENDAKTR